MSTRNINRRTILPYAILILLSFSSGCLAFLFSRILVRSGFGAVQFFWAWQSSGEAELNVTQSYPAATETVNAPGLRLESLNSSVTTVSIEVVGEQSGILLNRSLVSEGMIGMTFPVSEPTGWHPSQDFNVTIFWEGSNATLVIEYSRLYVTHADGYYDYTLPGFSETQNLSILLLKAGLVVLVIGFGVILVKNRR